jgi:methylmalonyl-CoA/ethylmalonyl-CoA epimerase
VKAAIIGNEAGDHVIEVIGYPNEPAPADGDARPAITQPGISHIGIVCDDIDDARARIASAGGTFIVSGVAEVARLRTTWFRDPWGVLFILMEKHDQSRAYWLQYG